LFHVIPTRFWPQSQAAPGCAGFGQSASLQHGLWCADASLRPVFPVIDVLHQLSVAVAARAVVVVVAVLKCLDS